MKVWSNVSKRQGKRTTGMKNEENYDDGDNGEAGLTETRRG
jgi:hypothetical protein